MKRTDDLAFGMFCVFLGAFFALTLGGWKLFLTKVNPPEQAILQQAQLEGYEQGAATMCEAFYEISLEQAAEKNLTLQYTADDVPGICAQIADKLAGGVPR